MTITTGTRVAFSRNFSRSTGQFTGWVPFARGTVVKLQSLGEITLATVNWDDRTRIAGEPGPPQSRVNTRNLVREDRIHLEPQ